jgi:hypothetical protein
MAEEPAFFYGAPGASFSSTRTQLEEPDPAPPEAKKMSWAARAKPAASVPFTEVDTSPPPVPTASCTSERPKLGACSFYLQGACRYGASCRYRHDDAPPPAAVAWFEARIARACAEMPAAAGSALEPATEAVPGSEPSATFAALADEWEKDALATPVDEALVEAVSAGLCPSIEAAESALQAAERSASASAACGICLETVLEVPGRRFGLLTSCTHAFCLPCIREWRARIDLPSATVRACPVCRVTSYFVVPSDRFLVEPRRKAALRETYTSGQRALPCRLFNYGSGSCPFGSSCWFAHTLPDGTAVAVAKPVFRFNADGEHRPVREMRLNEFLG